MSILNNKVSYFKTTKETAVLGNFPISQAIDYIRDGKFKSIIEKLRAGDKSVKTQLPTVAMHGIFESERKKNNFIEASGLIILDIDDVDVNEIEDIKNEIMEDSNSIVAVMTSPSGNGIKVLHYVDSNLVNADNYREIGKQLVQDYVIYGEVDYLSVTDCLILSYDPNILVNEYAEPQHIILEKKEVIKGDLQPLDTSRKLWDDAQDFFETVLQGSIEEKVNNNFHYIQVAILDLKKFGFEHPKEDLQFVIEYAEAAFKRSADNFRRFQEVVELAKQYPQTQWPYKSEKQKEVIEEEYVDYSTLNINNEDMTEEEVEETNGLVDYGALYNKVVETIKEGDRVGYETSHQAFSDIFRFKGSGILTVTGIPGHGKTEFVDSCILDLARLHGHESIICGFEQTPEEHIIKPVSYTHLRAHETDS